MPYVMATEYNVFATDFGVCLTIAIIFNAELVLVIKATKCNCDNIPLMLTKS